jgi:hypothetical protein
MKKGLLLIMAVCLVSFAWAQKKNVPKKIVLSQIAKIVVDKQFDYGETFRTFSITQVNFENAKAKFIKQLGKPSTNTLGTLKWKNINLPEIGENLTLTLQDGVFETEPGDVTYTVFADKKTKVRALQSLSATKFRMLSFKITNAENINVIRNNNLEAEAMKFLENLKL